MRSRYERSLTADASRVRIWQVNRDVRVDATPGLDLRPSTPNPRRKQSESYKPLLRNTLLRSLDGDEFEAVAAGSGSEAVLVSFVLALLFSCEDGFVIGLARRD